MTEEQYQSLCQKYSKEFADKCIEELDLYKQSSGRTYKSDYHAILHWVVDKVKKSCSFSETASFSQPVCENSPDVNPFDAMLGGM